MGTGSLISPSFFIGIIREFSNRLDVLAVFWAFNLNKMAGMELPPLRLTQLRRITFEIISNACILFNLTYIVSGGADWAIYSGAGLLISPSYFTV